MQAVGDIGVMAPTVNVISLFKVNDQLIHLHRVTLHICTHHWAKRCIVSHLKRVPVWFSVTWVGLFTTYYIKKVLLSVKFFCFNKNEGSICCNSKHELGITTQTQLLNDHIYCQLFSYSSLKDSALIQKKIQ